MKFDLSSHLWYTISRWEKNLYTENAYVATPTKRMREINKIGI